MPAQKQIDLQSRNLKVSAAAAKWRVAKSVRYFHVTRLKSFADGNDVADLTAWQSVSFGMRAAFACKIASEKAHNLIHRMKASLAE